MSPVPAAASRPPARPTSACILRRLARCLGLAGLLLLPACITEPARPARPAPTPAPPGKLLLLSDVHFSPYTDVSVMPHLAAAPVTAWDALFASASNGLFTADATGHKTTSPLLLHAALAQAQAACPDPDAVFLLGDFPYYDLIPLYTNFIPNSTRAQGRAVLAKVFAYVHRQVRQAFPTAPIFFTLGNNDTFLEDYDIAPSGDAFYHATAPVFHAGAITNQVTQENFAATYTNFGAYAAAFGAGEIISLQSLYFSAQYPCGAEPGSNQLAFLATRLAAAAAARRPAWILLHIPPGIDPYATWTARAEGAPQAVVTSWAPGFLEPFCALIAAYSNTVAGLFAGHYHTRSWQLISDPEHTNALAALHIATGLLYNHGNNPGFTVLGYDRQTFRLLTENTYCLDVARHTGRRDPAAPWSIHFSQDAGYGLADLSATALAQLWPALCDFTGAAAQFCNQAYSGGRTPYALNPTNWPVYYNALRHTLPRQFLDALRAE